MRRRWVWVGIGLAVLLIALVLGVRSRSRARLEAAVVPRLPPSGSECAESAQRLGYGPETARDLCQMGEGRPWFHATVRNVGRSGTWPVCIVDGLDRSERSLFVADLPFGLLSFPAGPHLEPGESLTLDWYLRTQLPVDPVERYVAHCRGEDRSEVI